MNKSGVSARACFYPSTINRPALKIDSSLMAVVQCDHRWTCLSYNSVDEGSIIDGRGRAIARILPSRGKKNTVLARAVR